MERPRCTIVLPTWNGAADLARLLPRLAEQQLDGGFELAAVDSSSTDGTRALLEAAGARLRVIPQAEFRHGGTRNLGAEGARGEFLVFLTQDALPAGRDFLARLLAAFDDPRTAGAYARILPHPGDDPLTARTALEQPEAGERAVERELAPGRPLDALSPAERAELCRFNNVASAIRADVFRALPFPDVAFGEDSAWAERALAAGWRVRFVPEAVVHHAHDYTPAEAFRRYRVDAAFQREHNGFRVRPSLFSVLRGFAFEVCADLRYLSAPGIPRRFSSALRSPFLRAAQVLGQYAGSRGTDAANARVDAEPARGNGR